MNSHRLRNTSSPKLTVPIVQEAMSGAASSTASRSDSGSMTAPPVDSCTISRVASRSAATVSRSRTGSSDGNACPSRMCTWITLAPSASHSSAVLTSSSRVTVSAGTSALLYSAPVGATVIRVPMTAILPRREPGAQRGRSGRLALLDVLGEPAGRRAGVVHVAAVRPGAYRRHQQQDGSHREQRAGAGGEHPRHLGELSPQHLGVDPYVVVGGHHTEEDQPGERHRCEHPARPGVSGGTLAQHRHGGQPPSHSASPVSAASTTMPTPYPMPSPPK